jgi:hypothetical protein
MIDLKFEFEGVMNDPHYFFLIWIRNQQIMVRKIDELKELRYEIRYERRDM